MILTETGNCNIYLYDSTYNSAELLVAGLLLSSSIYPVQGLIARRSNSLARRRVSHRFDDYLLYGGCGKMAGAKALTSADD